jgi:energy-coupling factor transport system permease protein
MNPRALAAWSAATLGCVLLTNNPVYRVLLLLAGANLVLAVAPRRVRPLAVGLGIAGLFALLLNSLLAHAGSHVYARVPTSIPLVGGPLTLESAIYGLDIAAGLAAALLAVAPLSLAADPADLVDALPAGLERTGAALAASLSLVPGVARTFVAVSEAQRMRGWRPRGPRSWTEVLVPVMLTAIEDSIQLAEAMAARGYGAGGRSHYLRLAWGRRDSLVLLVAVVAAVGFAAARATGALGDWYPYPTLTFPPVEPVLVLLCLLLALPALTWRSRS